MDPRMLASTGLGMDIAGIVLLFFCGGIGSAWIDRNREVLELASDDAARKRDRCLARIGSWLALILATGGFALQLRAQWL